MITAFQIIHSTVRNDSYRSAGEFRRQEMHCIFHYTVSGHGEVIYQGVPYQTNPGQGFFNIINEESSGYRYPQCASEPWEFVVICFDGGNLRQIVSELSEKQTVYTITDTGKFYMMCRKLLENANTDMKLTFFPRLLSMIYDSDESLSQLSVQFQKIVETDFLANPTMSSIASRMHISREHLQREYLKECGNTPAKYLNQKRFEHLCYLLSTSASESEISDLMHFSSVSAMSVFFKRYTGITPRQYRKNGYMII